MAQECRFTENMLLHSALTGIQQHFSGGNGGSVQQDKGRQLPNGRPSYIQLLS